MEFDQKESKDRTFISINELKLIANSVRMHIISMISNASSGHLGGSLSCVEILVALYFSGQMIYDKSNCSNHDADRFLLSKGHAAPALYSIYEELGWIDHSDSMALRKIGSKLQGHPDSKYLPAIEVCSGSLGQGISIGCGLAIGLKENDLSEPDQKRVYVLCGDGELQEGSNWEAIMFAAHRKLDNLTVLIDNNGLQIDGSIDEINSLGDLALKLNAFGWTTITIDGNDIPSIIESLIWAKSVIGKPQAIICKTIKGKGVSFMENERSWHGRVPTSSETLMAMNEIIQERNIIMEGIRHAG